MSPQKVSCALRLGFAGSCLLVSLSGNGLYAVTSTPRLSLIGGIYGTKASDGVAILRDQKTGKTFVLKLGQKLPGQSEWVVVSIEMNSAILRGPGGARLEITKGDSSSTSYETADATVPPVESAPAEPTPELPLDTAALEQVPLSPDSADAKVDPDAPGVAKWEWNDTFKNSEIDSGIDSGSGTGSGQRPPSPPESGITH